MYYHAGKTKKPDGESAWRISFPPAQLDDAADAALLDVVEDRHVLHHLMPQQCSELQIPLIF